MPGLSFCVQEVRLKPRTCLLIVGSLLGSVAMAVQPGWPTRQAGLWEMDVKVGSAPSVRVRQCTRPEVDIETFMMIIPAQENCRRQIHRQSSDKWRMATVCDIHGHNAHGDIRLEGDPGKALRGSYSVREPHRAEPATGSFQARYVGPCDADWKPGDMVLPNRVKVNVADQAHDHDHDDHEHKH